MWHWRNGWEVHYEVCRQRGRGPSIPLLLLPGFGVGTFHFRRNMQEVSQAWLGAFDVVYFSLESYSQKGFRQARRSGRSSSDMGRLSIVRLSCRGIPCSLIACQMLLQLSVLRMSLSGRRDTSYIGRSDLVCLLVDFCWCCPERHRFDRTTTGR